MKFSKLRRAMTGLTAAAVLASLAPMAMAQSAAGPDVYKIVVPLPAGGGVDVFVRKLGESLAKNLNKSVVVENKPGASGQIAVQAVGGTVILQGIVHSHAERDVAERAAWTVEGVRCVIDNLIVGA